MADQSKDPTQHQAPSGHTSTAQAIKKKGNLEKALQEVVRDFEEDTGLYVTYLDVSRVEMSSRQGTKSLLVSIGADVELPSS